MKYLDILKFCTYLANQPSDTWSSPLPKHFQHQNKPAKFQNWHNFAIVLADVHS